MKTQINKEQFRLWKENIVTERLHSELVKQREDLLFRIGNSTSCYKTEDFAVNIARDCGMLEALNIVLTAELYDEEEKDAKQQTIRDED